MVNVGKYTVRPMDAMRSVSSLKVTRSSSLKLGWVYMPSTKNDTPTTTNMEK